MISSLSFVIGQLTLLVWIFSGLSFFSMSANSHELRPAIADFTSNARGEYQIELKLNLESWLAGIGNSHSDTSDSPNSVEYNRVRALSGEQLKELLLSKITELQNSIILMFDEEKYSPIFVSSQIPPVGDTDLARDSVIRFKGNIPAGVTRLVWRYQISSSVLRVIGSQGKQGEEKDQKVAVFVNAGEASRPIEILSPVQPSFLENLVTYISVGFDHIIPKGLDHILFVVGLFLLSTRWSPLLWQVSAFTLAHTVTLGLGMAGVISLPANIVEPLIAASIVYIAVENLYMDRLGTWRAIIVFCFGLLHGMGFASVLEEFGLGSGSFLSGLIGFNIGVELGQLTVIAVCFVLVGFWFGQKSWYHQWVTVPGSILIGAIGSWWFFQRVLLA